MGVKRIELMHFKDPQTLLSQNGESSCWPSVIRISASSQFTSNHDVAPMQLLSEAFGRLTALARMGIVFRDACEEEYTVAAACEFAWNGKTCIRKRESPA